MHRGAYVLTLIFGAAVSLAGQTFGEITGEVRDPSGSVIAGAELKVSSKSTGAVRSAITNETGVYSIPALLPGVYDISAAAKGFQSVVQSGFELQIQQTARMDFTMKVGTATETLEVTSEAPLLATENATVGTVVENKRIVDLPLNGRDFLELISLAPNVNLLSGLQDSDSSGGAAARLGTLRSQQIISVAGQRGEFNHYTLDGIENTDPTFNTYVFLPSVDALQEFKVQTGIYPAEFGRAIGQVNVSTKAGTNQLHGSAFEFFRNDRLDSDNYSFDGNNTSKKPFHWNQYGFVLGGPIFIPKLFDGRNRLFFLTNFEGYKDRATTAGLYNVPYTAMRLGDFSGFPAIYDPDTRIQQGSGIIATPFPNNMIPASRLSPQALRLLEFIPAPNVNTGSYASDFQQDNAMLINSNQFTERIDFIQNAKSTWYGRYSSSSELNKQTGIAGTGTNVTSEPRQYMISNSYIFSPTLLNVASVSQTGLANNLTTPLAGVRDVNAELGIPGFTVPYPSAWGVPYFTINPFSVFGDVENGPYVQNNHIIQFVDSISWTKGRHALRMGAEIRRDRFNVAGNSGSRGTLNFNGTATENPALPLGYSSGTGTAMADFLLGDAQQATIPVGEGFGQFRSTSQYYFIDDTWRIHPKVTISMGLRYENTPPYKDKSQSFVNLDWPLKLPPGVVDPADQALHPTLVRIGQGNFYQGINLRFNPAINVARDGRLGAAGIFPDNADFAPRLGIAWSPSDRWTIRSGVGVFYVQDIADVYLDASRNLAGTRVATSNTNFPNVPLSNPFGETASSSLLTVSTPKILGIDPHLRTPYVIQYVFNIQRQLSKDTMVEVGYVGSEDHKLDSWEPFNEPVASAIGTPQSRAPFPEFSVQGWLVEGVGNGSYNSLEVKLEHRFSRGFSLLSDYTWSKAIDMSSSVRNHNGEQQFPQTTYCLKCERGLSNFNVGQRFVNSALYELPFGKGKALLGRGGLSNAFLGGWQISSILTMQSGQPADVTNGYDAPNNGQPYVSRPNATGVSVALPNPSPSLWFNKAAFARPPLGTYGNIGRNTIIGPGIINLDLSILKNFQVRESQRVELRAETFNLPNHPNFGLPDTTLTDTNFGVITYTSTNMREIQLAVKYIF